MSGTRIIAQKKHFALTACSASDNSPDAYARELFERSKDL